VVGTDLLWVQLASFGSSNQLSYDRKQQMVETGDLNPQIKKVNFRLCSHRYSFSVRVQGPKIWNNLPLSLRNSLTISNCRQKLRDYIG